MTTCTNTEVQQPKQKFVVARLDIYHAPGWFTMQEYDNYQDAYIYCDMLNNDTNMVHRVFVEEVSDVLHQS